jgi:THO complex subunit 2
MAAAPAASPAVPAPAPAPVPTPTQHPQQAAPPQPAHPPPNTDPLPYYHYIILNADAMLGWSAGGRDLVIHHGTTSRDDVDMTELSNIFQEFTRSIAEGRLGATDAGECVREILGPETQQVIKDVFSFDPHTLFLDTVAVMMDNDPTLLRPQLREFLMATGVSTALMRQILDAPVLQSLGLIRDSFVKLGIRQSTNLLYRQANYNLLREETEGYSKLITELFTTSSNEPPSAATVATAFERTKGLIGTFDLDVGRVLDVTLDVFASVLIKQFRFFVKFLRVSSWWPRSPTRPDGLYSGGLPAWGLVTSAAWTLTEEEEEEVARQRLERDVRFWGRAREHHLGAFFELGGYELADSSRLLESARQDENALRREWVEATNTNPPSGNRTAAQLLGFKLRFYNSGARDSADVLPANLLYLSALLIKIGFISLCDLYEHLWPDDSDMDALKEKKMAELQEKERASRPGGGMNALMMAGALTDDAPSALPARRDAKADDPKAAAAAAADPAKSDLPEPMEQKVSLLVCLLTIGALPESLFLIGRFPWVLDAFPDVLDRVHRILNHALDKVHRDCLPTQTHEVECPTKLIADADRSASKGGPVGVGRTPQKKFLRWPFPDKFDFADCQNYRFYWDEWADNVPVCQTVDDVFTLCDSLLNISGVKIGRDEGLLFKLARIGARSLREDPSDANMLRWHDLLRRLLVPALSHTKPNAAVVNAVWGLLSQYPTPVRYGVYADWFEGPTSRLPAMRAAFAKSRLETLSTMKRLSLTNLKEMAKTLAKTSLSSPGIVFKVALDQIESYANLIDAFVECARYFTDLAYDVLVWSLLSSLGGKSRSRTQESSILLTSKWLQALAKFSGQVFKRYANMDPTPVIQYVDNQLLQGNSTDLIILKEFISSMGGIVQTIDFTDAQIMAMSGGPILRRQTLVAGQDKRFESSKTARRLTTSLVQSGLVRRMLVNMSQYREAALYQVPEDEAHIKYLSSVVDDSHQILIQFLDFLRSHLDGDVFDGVVPSVVSLMGEYGLGVGISFMIGRDTLSDRMFPKRDDAAAKDDEGDVAMAASSDDKMEERAVLRKAEPILDTLQPVIDAVQTTMPSRVWEHISPEFFAMFWALQLGDLAVPIPQYQDEKTRILARVEVINRDRSDMTRAGVDRKNQDRTRLLDVAQSLLHEQKEHETRHLKNKIYITRRFKTWFPGGLEGMKDLTADAMLEECLLPRLVVSAADTEYCHRLVRALHDWNAPGFRLMTLYQRLFSGNRLRSLVFDSTVREAEHVGRYLKLVLADLAAWHRDKDVYEKEALLGSRSQKERSLVGFATTLDANGKPQAFVEHDRFRDMLWDWHRNLNMALKSALAGMEWMHIRNAITILKAVLDSFPAVDFMANKFVGQLKTITERESVSKAAAEGEEGHRVDLSVAAQSALSELQKRKPKWVKLVTDFRPNLVSLSSFERIPPSTLLTLVRTAISRPIQNRQICARARPSSSQGSHRVRRPWPSAKTGR